MIVPFIKYATNGGSQQGGAPAEQTSVSNQGQSTSPTQRTDQVQEQTATQPVQLNKPVYQDDRHSVYGSSSGTPIILSSPRRTSVKPPAVTGSRPSDITSSGMVGSQAPVITQQDASQRQGAKPVHDESGSGGPESQSQPSASGVQIPHADEFKSLFDTVVNRYIDIQYQPRNSIKVLADDPFYNNNREVYSYAFLPSYRIYKNMLYLNKAIDTLKQPNINDHDRYAAAAEAAKGLYYIDYDIWRLYYVAKTLTEMLNSNPELMGDLNYKQVSSDIINHVKSFFNVPPEQGLQAIEQAARSMSESIRPLREVTKKMIEDYHTEYGYPYQRAGGTDKR